MQRCIHQVCKVVVTVGVVALACLELPPQQVAALSLAVNLIWIWS
jgi:hypothetical protein